MKRFTTHITEAQLNEENCSCCDNKIDADGKCGCGPDCEHCGGQHDVDEGSCGTVNASKKTVKEAGLWDNIHAKRKRIKNGSGEKMKKPGSKGAPTDQDFKDASESVELDEAPIKLRGFGPDHKKASGSSLKKIAGAKVAATEEVELDEAPRRKGAPKIKPDFLKVQRAKDAEHNAAMGRTKTGRKKPVRTMTSTQRSLAQLRGEAVELDESNINQLCADYINENNIDPAIIENMTEEELNEFIGKAIGGAVKLGAKAVIGTARLAGKGAKRAVTTKQGSFRGTKAAKQDKAGDRAEKMAKKREAVAKRAERIRNAQDRSDAADARLSDLKKNK